MSSPATFPCTTHIGPASTSLLAAMLLAGCASSIADPVASAIAVAEQRCECTRQQAPNVARCVNQAAHGLHRATQAAESAVRSAMVRAYEDAFRKCPWDDPSYYR